MARFKKSDRRAILLVFAAVVIAWGSVLIDRQWRPQQEMLTSLEALSADSIVLDSIYNRVSLTSAHQQAQGRYDAIPSPAHETFPFDPNTADSATLLRLGLAPWQVRSIYKYRAKGGRYHRAEDFQRVPGMTPEVWNRLATVIQIGEAFRFYHDLRTEKRDSTPRHTGATDSTRYPRQEKFTEMVVLDLNTTDTSELKKIPGIGSVRARQIVRYRDKLGGFVSLEQLAEIPDLPAGIEKWFSITTVLPPPVHINKLSAAQLARHPYLTYTQAKAIVEYRRNYGNIKKLDELKLLKLFTEAEEKRLTPYIVY